MNLLDEIGSCLNQGWYSEAMATLSDTGIEQMLLGGLLAQFRPEGAAKFYAAVCDTLRPEDFVDDTHQAIYVAIESVSSSGDGFSPLSVARKMGVDTNSKVAKYLIGLSINGCNLSNIKSYAKSVSESSKKRKAINDISLALDDILDKPIDVAIAKLANIVSESESVSNSRVVDSRTLSYSICDELKLPRIFYQTGLKTLDMLMGGGFIPGKCYAFCARKKTGKTMLASTMAFNLAKQGVPMFFMACEMSPKEIHQRNLARAMDVNSSAFLHSDAWDKLSKKLAEVCVSDFGNIHYFSGSGCTFEQMKRELYRAVYRLGVKVFFLDYIQLIGGQKRGQSFAEHMDEVSQWLAEFCLQENVAGCVIAQMNQTGNVRGGEGLRLAFSQVYELKKCENLDNGYWLDMMDTRYTKWGTIGTEDSPGLTMDNAGPHFKELSDD